MKTRCPYCESIFTVSAEIVQSLDARVRCGICLSVFNARDELHTPSTSNDSHPETTPDFAVQPRQPPLGSAPPRPPQAQATTSATVVQKATTGNPILSSPLAQVPPIGQSNAYDPYSYAIPLGTNQPPASGSEVAAGVASQASATATSQPSQVSLSTTPQPIPASTVPMYASNTAVSTGAQASVNPLSQPAVPSQSVPATLQAQAAPTVQLAGTNRPPEAVHPSIIAPLPPDAPSLEEALQNLKNRKAAPAPSLAVPASQASKSDADAQENIPTSNPSCTDQIQAPVEPSSVEDTTPIPPAETNKMDHQSAQAEEPKHQIKERTAKKKTKNDFFDYDSLPKSIKIKGKHIAVTADGKKLHEARRSSGWWLFGSFILAVMIVTLWLYSNKDHIMSSPSFRPLVNIICDGLNMQCELGPLVDRGRIKLLKYKIDNHPTVDDAWVLNLDIVNKAPFEQSFPILGVELIDRRGKIIGQRNFKPEEYLPPHTLGQPLVPGNEIKVKLEIMNPGNEADGFQVDFL